jgi:hypothetical protein
MKQATQSALRSSQRPFPSKSWELPQHLRCGRICRYQRANIFCHSKRGDKSNKSSETPGEEPKSPAEDLVDFDVKIEPTDPAQRLEFVEAAKVAAEAAAALGVSPKVFEGGTIPHGANVTITSETSGKETPSVKTEDVQSSIDSSQEPKTVAEVPAAVKDSEGKPSESQRQLSDRDIEEMARWIDLAKNEGKLGALMAKAGIKIPMPDKAKEASGITAGPVKPSTGGDKPKVEDKPVMLQSKGNISLPAAIKADGTTTQGIHPARFSKEKAELRIKSIKSDCSVFSESPSKQMNLSKIPDDYSLVELEWIVRQIEADLQRRKSFSRMLGEYDKSLRAKLKALRSDYFEKGGKPLSDYHVEDKQ